MGKDSGGFFFLSKPDAGVVITFFRERGALIFVVLMLAVVFGIMVSRNQAFHVVKLVQMIGWWQG